MAQLQSSLFDVCDDGSSSFLYGLCCATCLSAQLKAELDERNCSVCDCMCSGWPYNQVAIRRQLRTKYGLQLDIATENCGCLFNTCTNSRKTTYTEDCWLPECVACAGQMVGASFGFDQLGTMLRSMQLCQTTRELRRLENMPLGSFDSSNMCFGRLTTNQVKGQSKPHHQAKYEHRLCECCNNMSVCWYGTCCMPCLLGEATAMAQGRNYDAVDCWSHYTPFELRKTVMAKYNLQHPPETYACGTACQPCFNCCASCLKESPQDVTDGCCACWCGPCMVCQDYKELTAYAEQAPAAIYEEVAEPMIPQSQAL